jgi:hypothetical protein
MIAHGVYDRFTAMLSIMPIMLASMQQPISPVDFLQALQDWSWQIKNGFQ